MTRRVVVTGLGVVSPVGNSTEEFWQNLINSVSGIGNITKFDTSNFEVKIAGEVKNFDITNYIDGKRARRMDPVSHYAIVSAKQALGDAELKGYEKETAGCIIGTGIGGIKTWEEQHKVLLEEGPDRVSAFTIPMLMPNAPPAETSIEEKLLGVNYGTVSACASGTHALIDAYKAIVCGDVDIVVAGGSEAAITPLSIASFQNMRALTKSHNDAPEKASRPFDAKRDGFVIGEGAGIVVLEDLENALKRNAKIYAEMAGYGMSCDAFHITKPDENGKGAATAMQLAIKKAGICPEEVNYINAHGTSTPLNDRIETMAIKTVFGNYAYMLPVSSTKSMTGHLLGGAGGIEAIVCILAIETGIIPPTINLEFPDPECDLDYVPNKAREKKVDVAMSNSFGFGGHNAVIILKKHV